MSKDVKFYFWGNGKENKDLIPKIIWVYWEGDSEVVKRCISKLYSLQSDFEINILNNHTLQDFLPNISPARPNLPLANYADLIRLDLLNTY